MGGVDFAFEVVGTQKTIEQALASTHRGGMCVVVQLAVGGLDAERAPVAYQDRVLHAGRQEAGIPGTSTIAVVVPPPAVLISMPVPRDLDRDPRRVHHVGTWVVT